MHTSMIFIKKLERTSVIDMKHRKYILMIILLLIIVLSSCEKVYSDIDKYDDYVESIPGANEYMPKLTDLPIYIGYEVFYVENSGKSINLNIKYDTQDYEEAKTTILDRYDFLDEPLMGNGYSIIPEVEILYENYVIKVIYDESFKYPEAFGLLGYSDVDSTISFMFFYDESMNSLGNSYSMEDLIEDSFRFSNN